MVTVDDDEDAIERERMAIDRLKKDFLFYHFVFVLSLILSFRVLSTTIIA